MQTDTQTELGQFAEHERLIDEAKAHAKLKAHADKLAEALRKVRTCASVPDSVMDLVKKAIAAYEAAQ